MNAEPNARRTLSVVERGTWPSYKGGGRVYPHISSNVASCLLLISGEVQKQRQASMVFDFCCSSPRMHPDLVTVEATRKAFIEWLVSEWFVSKNNDRKFRGAILPRLKFPRRVIIVHSEPWPTTNWPPFVQHVSRSSSNNQAK
jgi:hypothetical protein